MSSRVLLIEDEESLLVFLTDRLRSEGYHVETAEDGKTGFERASNEPFDLIILDVMLPLRSGFDVCRDLRQCGIGVPILMLTARGEVVDRVIGLKLGADDYLVKPFEPIELLARMEAMLRRSPVSTADEAAEIYRFGQIRVDRRRGEVKRDNAQVELLPKEYRLLCYMIEHRDMILSRNRLLDEVWGYNATPTTRTVDTHIAGLRQKLEVDPRRPKHILTVHRLGYKFVGWT
jgi:two-component system, OmpR family, alkaline phosphatase synthesis response regulator PhoP